MDPRRRLVAAAAVAAALLGACSSSRSADDTLAPLGTSDTGSAPTEPAPVTSGAVTTTAVPATSEAPSTSASPSTPATPTTGATTAPTTEATTVTAATTSPPSSGGGELVLRPDGVGDANMGDDADTVIAAFEGQLGGPDEDTGWEEPLAAASCTDGEYRRVSWGALSLLFTDSSDYDQGPRHLFGYEYGIVGQPGADPSGLTTEVGVGIGTTVAELQQSYSEAVVNEEIEGSESASFYVTDGLQGLLSGTGDDDIISFIAGGQPCGL